MWTLEPLPMARRLKITADAQGEKLSVAEVLQALATDDVLRLRLRELLRELPYEAYFWELPPLSTSRLRRPFECVVTASDALAGLHPDWRSFREPFRAAGGDADVAVFSNLGGDAVLIAPLPERGDEPWAHLGAFAANADDAAWHRLFARVATTVLERLSARPLWLSTSGTGVPWLHVRLDSTPKYFVHAPYRRLG